MAELRKLHDGRLCRRPLLCYRKEAKGWLLITYCIGLACSALLLNPNYVLERLGKMKYLVKVREIFEHTYLVEAESKEAAEEIVIDNSDGCDPYDDLVDTVYETREPKDDEAMEYYDECYPKVKKSRNSIDTLLDFKRQLNETII